MNRSLLSVDRDSCDLVAPMRARLASFCADPPLHARFLNMLSLLEHIGSRKIMASTAQNWPRDRLRHLAEESRHAYFFKRAAEKIAGRPLDYSPPDTLAAPFARFYMGRLDANIARSLNAKAATLAYLYMSLIVELRAVWAYLLYQTVLAERDCGINLKSLLAEEDLHLDSMLAQLSDRDADFADRIVRFCAFENSGFRRLWRAIEDESARFRLAAE
jgi:hypothetical protein